MGFGASSQKSNQQSQTASSSNNQAYPFLQGALGNQVSQGTQGTNALYSLLGLNGADAQNSGFDTFRNNSGYDFMRDQGVEGITTSNAAKGLLNSGSTLKAITGYSSNLANNFLNTYLTSLTGASNSGLQAAQVLAGAGQTSQSKGNSSGVSSGSSANFSLG